MQVFFEKSKKSMKLGNFFDFHATFTRDTHTLTPSLHTTNIVISAYRWPKLQMRIGERMESEAEM